MASRNTKAVDAPKATKPTLASLKSEVDSLTARLVNEKKLSKAYEDKLITASGRIINLEIEISEIENETLWNHFKRKVYYFFTFGW